MKFRNKKSPRHGITAVACSYSLKFYNRGEATNFLQLFFIPSMCRKKMNDESRKFQVWRGEKEREKRLGFPVLPVSQKNEFLSDFAKVLFSAELVFFAPITEILCFFWGGRLSQEIGCFSKESCNGQVKKECMILKSHSHKSRFFQLLLQKALFWRLI